MGNLSKIKKGEKASIVGFSSNPVMCNMSRLGILKGDIITCVAKLGPIIITKNQLKLAIGKHLAKEIYIEQVV